MMSLPAKISATPELGPAMRSLPPRWQRCVYALFACKGNLTQAIEDAGYKGTRKSLHRMASRLFGDDRVRAAIREECVRRIDVHEPEMLETVLDIARNPEEKAADRLRAAAMVWDRSRPVESNLKIDVQHHVSTDERDLQHYRALQKLGAPREAFTARFGINGLPRIEAMAAAELAKQQQIEGSVITVDADDYEEVVPDDDEETEPEELP